MSIGTHFWLLIRIICLLVLAGLVLLTIYSPTFYLSILLGLFPSIIAVVISAVGIFSSKKLFFKKKHVESNASNNIEFFVFKLLFLAVFFIGVYHATPILNGVFQTLVLNKPYETVDGVVVSIYSASASNRIYHSNTECVFWWSCHFKLENYPNREFEYDTAASLRVGDRVKLSVLPGSNFVLGNASDDI